MANKYDINNSSSQLKYTLPGTTLPATSNRYDTNTASKEVGSLIDKKTLQQLVDDYLATLGLTDTYYAGWSPVLNLETVGDERTVLKLVGYIGGQGTMPIDNIGSYFGPSGFVINSIDAVDLQGDNGQDGQDGAPFVVNSTGAITTSGDNSTIVLDNYDGTVASATSPYWHIVTTDGRTPPSTPVINIVGGSTPSGNLAGHLIMSYDYDGTIPTGTWVDIGEFTTVKGDDGDYVEILYSPTGVDGTYTVDDTNAKYIWIKNLNGVTNAIISEYKGKFVGDDGIGADGKGRVSILDDSLGYLSEKLVAGTNIGLAVLNPDGDETLQINNTTPNANTTTTGLLTSTDWNTFNGKVPYTGATANVDLGGFNLLAKGLNLDTNIPYIVTNPGDMGWNDEDG
ncbi:hypothetical protein, partial [Romboutsia sp.]|uniref:hypothetical protein n=1 Tax=Romboutsia sp. TaxID=1965302 RepID=UPI003F390FD9